MARDWDAVFATWARPPSDTEEEKANRAERMITEAVRASPALASRDFAVYASGSYRNNTNVRLDSDIDVAVVLKDAWYSQFPPNSLPNREFLGYVDATYGLPQFRDDVGRALIERFGAGGVTAGDKAFDIHANTVRLDADVAVFLEHRRFSGRQAPNGGWLYDIGVEMRPRSSPSTRIINWHQHQYDQGVARNEVTKRRFKRVTRILKRLRNEMVESNESAHAEAAKPMASFLIECIVFNAPDSCFNLSEESFYPDVRAVITSLWNATKDEATADKLVEVSRMKTLFRDGQSWTRAQVHRFLLNAWQNVGFE
jgi:hypothetical protein